MVYHLLRQPDSAYEEPAAHSFDERERQALERRLVRRLERPGYQVALAPIGAT